MRRGLPFMTSTKMLNLFTLPTPSVTLLLTSSTSVWASYMEAHSRSWQPLGICSKSQLNRTSLQSSVINGIQTDEERDSNRLGVFMPCRSDPSLSRHRFWRMNKKQAGWSPFFEKMNSRFMFVSPITFGIWEMWNVSLISHFPFHKSGRVKCKIWSRRCT